jgi:hypothetical protein
MKITKVLIFLISMGLATGLMAAEMIALENDATPVKSSTLTKQATLLESPTFTLKQPTLKQVTDAAVVICNDGSNLGTAFTTATSARVACKNNGGFRASVRPSKLASLQDTTSNNLNNNADIFSNYETPATNTTTPTTTTTNTTTTTTTPTTTTTTTTTNTKLTSNLLDGSTTTLTQANAESLLADAVEAEIALAAETTTLKEATTEPAPVESELEETTLAETTTTTTLAKATGEPALIEPALAEPTVAEPTNTLTKATAEPALEEPTFTK